MAQDEEMALVDTDCEASFGEEKFPCISQKVAMKDHWADKDAYGEHGIVTNLEMPPEGLEHGAAATDSEAARTALLLMQFVQGLAFTVVIVDSYQVSQEVGGSMADSGLLVGIFMGGWHGVGGFPKVGNALMTAALHLWPDTWQKLRSWLRWCLFCDVCSAVCYVLVLQHVAFLGPWALFCLLLCRFCGGLGMGSTGQLAAVVIAQVTKAEELPNQMQRLQFWQSLGLGMGPPVAACALWAYDALPWQLGTRRAAACGALVLLQALTALAVARCPGHLAPVGSPPPQSGSKISSGGRSHLIGACWLLCALRGYAVAGAEVGTAVLLETGYGWTSRSIGLMIGWAFIASVPLRFAYTRLKDRLSTGLWIRVMSLCAIAGTCFLFSSASAVGLNLVLADLIIFPALYLGEGLTRGLMMQMVQDQAAVSVNTASFVAIAINNLARTLAPWLARFSISAGQPEEGQNLFAWGQLLCCVLFLVVFEVGIQRAS